MADALDEGHHAWEAEMWGLRTDVDITQSLGEGRALWLGFLSSWTLVITLLDQ